MEHGHDPTFIDDVKRAGQWGVQHSKCLETLITQRDGEHKCTNCKRPVTLIKRLLTVSIDGKETNVVRINSRSGYRCICGSEQCCECVPKARNFAARLFELMHENNYATVKQADLLVPHFDDNEMVSYDALRSTFLKTKTQRYRTIERVKKAAADEKTSQGGSFVYFLHSADDKIKIGTSVNVEERVNNLKCSSSVKLTLLLTIPGGVEIESDLHRKFKHLRLENGEWFKYTDEIRYFVDGAAYYKQIA